MSTKGTTDSVKDKAYQAASEELEDRGFSRIWTHQLSYRTRLAITFGGVAFITSVVAAVVLILIWDHQTKSFMLPTMVDVSFRHGFYRGLLLVGVASTVLASLAGVFFSRGLVEPITRITETAAALRGGDLHARTNLEGNDEIAQLGTTFDTMADAMEKDRELERRLTMDVAHELRTPLMAMQSTIEAMVDGVLPADETRLLTINAEVVRLGRLVEALLKLSRLENRSNPLKEEETDATELVRDLVTAHEMLIEDAGLSISFEGDEGVIIMADRDFIRQAVANLISNAVRYTPEGGSIDVRVKKGELMAQISVADTGIGIAEEDLKHVFSRFWRADAGRARETGGLGIGLAVVKESVDRHNGWVNVESVLGEGTTFTIYIPLYTEEVRRKREKAAKQAASKERQAQRERGIRLRLPRNNVVAASKEEEAAKAAKTAEETAAAYARRIAESAAAESGQSLEGPIARAATAHTESDEEAAKTSEKAAEEYARQVSETAAAEDAAAAAAAAADEDMVDAGIIAATEGAEPAENLSSSK